MRQIEKAVMLQQLDHNWKEHLAAMDYLRQGIHLRGYAQRNPKQEYKREAFEMFGLMLDQVKRQVISILARARLRGEEDVEAVAESSRPDERRMQFTHAEAASPIAPGSAEPSPASGPGAARRAAGGAAGAWRLPDAGAGRCALRAKRPQGRPQRALSLRVGQEVQAVPRSHRLAGSASCHD